MRVWSESLNRGYDTYGCSRLDHQNLDVDVDAGIYFIKTI